MIYILTALLIGVAHLVAWRARLQGMRTSTAEKILVVSSGFALSFAVWSIAGDLGSVLWPPSRDHVFDMRSTLLAVGLTVTVFPLLVLTVLPRMRNEIDGSAVVSGPGDSHDDRVETARSNKSQ